MSISEEPEVLLDYFPLVVTLVAAMRLHSKASWDIYCAGAQLSDIVVVPECLLGQSE